MQKCFNLKFFEKLGNFDATIGIYNSEISINVARVGVQNAKKCRFKCQKRHLICIKLTPGFEPRLLKIVYTK